MDCFLRELSEVFSGTDKNGEPSSAPHRSAGTAEQCFRQLQDCIVDDLVDNLVRRDGFQESRYILLAESPHTCEVARKLPMAGETGREVSRVLGETVGAEDLDELPALGILLSKTCLEPHWRRFGIMNVSRLPLQKEAFIENGHADNSTWLNALLESFKTIRNDMKVKPDKRHKAETGRVQEIILSDLRRRFFELSKKIDGSSQIHIVPCGEVAAHALNELCLPPQLIGLDTVPHPARNQWRYSKTLVCWLEKVSGERL